MADLEDRVEQWALRAGGRHPRARLEMVARAVTATRGAGPFDFLRATYRLGYYVKEDAATDAPLDVTVTAGIVRIRPGPERGLLDALVFAAALLADAAEPYEPHDLARLAILLYAPAPVALGGSTLGA